MVCANFSLLFTARFMAFTIKAHFLETHLNAGHCLCSALGSVSEAAFSVLWGGCKWEPGEIISTPTPLLSDTLLSQQVALLFV